MAARRCPACAHEYQLWEKVLKFTADPDTGEQSPVYGDLALRGFRLERKVKDFNQPIAELDAEDWELVQIISQARNEYEAWRAWKDAKDAERESR
ncbi:MAG: hypothetical protein L0229_22580 [Blastocatellia bacterium]|nr:hypothetical protein [Blastocatellia bacterium]